METGCGNGDTEKEGMEMEEGRGGHGNGRGWQQAGKQHCSRVVTFTKWPYSVLLGGGTLWGFLVLTPKRCSERASTQTPSWGGGREREQRVWSQPGASMKHCGEI